MNLLFIALALPPQIHEQLSRLCFGIPNVAWEDPYNFYLTILPVGHLDGATILDVQEKLAEITFAPFSLCLNGVGCFHSRGSKGVLWAGLEDSGELQKLKKIIYFSLREFIPNNEPFEPRVTLGRYDKVDARRLGDYLDMQTGFETPPFTVDSFLLVESHKTASNNTIYDELRRYPMKGI